MIGFLKGKILYHQDKELLLDVNGVGYLVFVNETKAYKIGESLALFIETVVREDHISLFGFENSESKKMFVKLVSISGIGPKTALEMMKVDIADLSLAIAEANVNFLVKIPGIGKKTAQRIILELKNVLNLDEVSGGQDAILQQELEQVLQSLGYKQYQIRNFLKANPQKFENVEQAVTYFLKNA
jgi:Holliday junction DNA helicase RuvA